MISARTLVVALVGTGCMAAAAAGGYLAVRSATATSAASAGLPSDTAVSVSTRERIVPNSPPAVAAPSRTTAAPPRPIPRPSPQGAPETTSLAVEPNRNTETVSHEEAPSGELAIASDNVVPAEPSPATEPTFTSLIVKADSVVGLRLDSPVSSETARIEDLVLARVTRDVSIDGEVAVPAGARLEGTVTTVERGGRFKERARIGIRFHALVLADRSRIPIQTNTIFRDGEAPGGEAASKVGAGAVAAAILGGIIGGKKGAAIGTAAGAAGGAAVVMAGGPNHAVIPAGAPLTVRLLAPVSIDVEHRE